MTEILELTAYEMQETNVTSIPDTRTQACAEELGVATTRDERRQPDILG